MCVCVYLRWVFEVEEVVEFVVDESDESSIELDKREHNAKIHITRHLHTHTHTHTCTHTHTHHTHTHTHTTHTHTHTPHTLQTAQRIKVPTFCVNA